MTRLVVVGAGGFGREVFNWVQRSNLSASSRETVFIDDSEEALSAFPQLAAQLISRIVDFTPLTDDHLIMAIAEPDMKREISAALQQRGGAFASLVHDSAVVSADAQVSTGSVICPGAVVCSNALLGPFVTLNVAASVGHDARVGEFASLMGHVDVTGGAVVGEGAWISSHASVLPGRVVGDGARVGAGSVVTADVEASQSVFGVPARAIPLIPQADGKARKSPAAPTASLGGTRP